jgi:probable HAF family extracellular repeat protein
MKVTFRSLPITTLCVALACGAVFAQVPPSPRGGVRSRGGLLRSRMKSQPTAAANHKAQSPGSPGVTFTFGIIDFPEQTDTQVIGVNDKGETVGGYGPSTVGFGASDHGFLLKGTKFTAIDYPGAAWTSPNSINDSGAIVGQYGTSGSDEHGFELVGKTYTTVDFPGAAYTSANGNNRHGDIVGGWVDSSEIAHGFLLSKGVFTSFDFPSAVDTEAFQINTAGEIVGMYDNSDGSTHGFLYSGGIFTTIDYPGGYSQNYASGINDQGVIVGAYGEPTDVNGVQYLWQHTFLYQSGQFTNADSPFGPPAVTLPGQISNNEVIVGEYVDNSDTVYGYEAAVAQQ